jgi:hypothetical protein
LRRLGVRTRFDNTLELVRTVICSVLLKCAVSRRLADSSELLFRQPGQNRDHFFHRVCKQDLFAWVKKFSIPGHASESIAAPQAEASKSRTEGE